MRKHPTILGIETSCDETAAAIVKNHQVIAEKTTVQILHEQYGGVVPELASRAHERLLMNVVTCTMRDAKLDFTDIDGIAVTYGPGLVGSLLVGISLAKGLAISIDKPLIGVNHIEGHLWSCDLSDERPSMPFLALIVSGGHTLLVKVIEFGHYEYLGGTRDDAVGELLDKTGRMMGFGFPAGADIDRAAALNTNSPVMFPRSKMKDDQFGFSFSGLKTAVLYYLRDHYSKSTEQNGGFYAGAFDIPVKDRNLICKGLMEAVSDMLIGGIKNALDQFNLNELVVCGGVSASKFLRNKISHFAESKAVKLYVPPVKYSTDNGAMIANVGSYLYQNSNLSGFELTVNPGLKLTDSCDSADFRLMTLDMRPTNDF